MGNLEAFVNDVQSIRFMQYIETSPLINKKINLLFIGNFDRVWDHMQSDILPNYPNINFGDGYFQSNDSITEEICNKYGFDYVNAQKLLEQRKYNVMVFDYKEPE